MKTIISICSISCLITSCTLLDEKDNQQPGIKRAIVVVNDESASVNWDNDSEPQRDQQLKGLLYERISLPTDLIYMAIHSGSGSVGNHRSIAWDHTVTDPEGQKLKSISGVLSFFRTPHSTPSDRQSSEIIELIPELVRLAAEYDSVSVCLVGDMVQEGSLRSFANTPLLSRRLAEEYGREDAQAIVDQYGVPKDALCKVVAVDVLLHSEELSSEYLDDYYRVFFQTLGYRSSIRWTPIR